MTIDVAVLDDEPDVRSALASLLRREGFAPVELADTHALSALAARGALPPVLLIDLDLGDVSAFDAIRALPAAERAPLIVAVTGHASDAWLFPAIEAGCVGYVLKSDAFTRLGDVVREVLAGGSPMSAEISRRVLARLRPERSDEPALSPRELEVLRALADGYAYEQIALRLEVSLASIRTYVMRAYTKLGVNTKSEATSRAMRLGLLR
jgi:DNA-binding NarL/FixJ family response regulator